MRTGEGLENITGSDCSQIYRTDFSASELEGIFFEDINLTHSTLWDSLLNDMKNKVPVFAYDNIKDAKERCDKVKIDKINSTINVESNLNKFIEAVKQLACEDKYIAIGMLSNFNLQDAIDQQGTLVQKAPINDIKRRNEIKKTVLNHMNTNCPDLIPEIERSHLILKQDTRPTITIIKGKHGTSTEEIYLNK